MRKLSILAMALLFAAGMVLWSGNVSAQTCVGEGKGFVDLDGDGYNDNAPDADGDGIPNGLDPDWVKNPEDGTGNMFGFKKANGPKFVDLDGDGFNDNAPDADGDGIPNGLDPDYVKNPQDGTGSQHAYKGENGKRDGTCTAMQRFNAAQTQTQSKSVLRHKYQNGGDGSGTQSGGGTGDGVCDGTGPKGSKGKQGGK